MGDLGFDQVFSRGVEAYGKAGDVFVGLTTSGNSPNILKALEEARRIGMRSYAVLGYSGCTL